MTRFRTHPLIAAGLAYGFACAAVGALVMRVLI